MNIHTKKNCNFLFELGLHLQSCFSVINVLTYRWLSLIRIENKGKKWITNADQVECFSNVICCCCFVIKITLHYICYRSQVCVYVQFVYLKAMTSVKRTSSLNSNVSTIASIFFFKVSSLIDWTISIRFLDSPQEEWSRCWNWFLVVKSFAN